VEPTPITSHEMLRLEYEKASDFCAHVDDVRNVITSFFLTLVAGAAIVLSKYIDDSLGVTQLATPTFIALIAAWGVAVIGGLFVITLARTRRVQLERYHTMNAILDECLLAEHRGIIPFSVETIANGRSKRAIPRRSTGSYAWTMVIVLPTSGLVAVGLLILVSDLSVGTDISRVLSIAAGGAAVAALDALYISLSSWAIPQPLPQAASSVT
jgi:hypothetical protein